MNVTETYTQISLDILLKLISEDDLNDLFVKTDGNLYPHENYSFDLEKLKKEKFFLRETTGGNKND
ncbi:hypothetical protein [Mycobacteroides abscessus]|uniref:hypothetical protein n=1 Tax=Desemzia sp. FAM 23989 TaxID=3259523 RepID=UPI0010474440